MTTYASKSKILQKSVNNELISSKTTRKSSN